MHCALLDPRPLARSAPLGDGCRARQRATAEPCKHVGQQGKTVCCGSSPQKNSMASAVDGGDLATWEPEPGDYPRTPGGSRVTFSREANRTHEYFPVEGAESSDLDVNVLPSISSSEGSGPQSGVKRRKRSKRAKKSRAKDAPKHPAGSQVGKVVGACSGEGLPRVSRSQSSSSFQSLGLDYSELGTTADISLSAAAGEWGHTNRSRSVEPEMVTSPTSSLQMPAP